MLMVTIDQKEKIGAESFVDVIKNTMENILKISRSG